MEVKVRRGEGKLQHVIEICPHKLLTDVPTAYAGEKTGLERGRSQLWRWQRHHAGIVGLDLGGQIIRRELDIAGLTAACSDGRRPTATTDIKRPVFSLSWIYGGAR
jgi:hypothetical protein